MTIFSSPINSLFIDMVLSSSYDEVGKVSCDENQYININMSELSLRIVDNLASTCCSPMVKVMPQNCSIYKDTSTILGIEEILFMRTLSVMPLSQLKSHSVFINCIRICSMVISDHMPAQNFQIGPKHY